MSDREMERALAADAAKLEALGQDSGRVPASPPATGKCEKWMTRASGLYDDRCAICGVEYEKHPVPASPRAPEHQCPVCEKRGESCKRFVSGAHVFKHYGVSPAPAAPGVDWDASRAATLAWMEANPAVGPSQERLDAILAVHREAVDAQVRALVDAAREEERQERERVGSNIRFWAEAIRQAYADDPTSTAHIGAGNILAALAAWRNK